MTLTVPAHGLENASSTDTPAALPRPSRRPSCRPARFTVRHDDGSRTTATSVRSAMGDHYGAVVRSCTGLSDRFGGLAVREPGGYLCLWLNARLTRARREQLVFLLLVELAGPDAVTEVSGEGAFTAAAVKMPEQWAPRGRDAEVSR